MRQFIKFTEELSGFLMFLRLIYFMIKYVEVKINFLIHYRLKLYIYQNDKLPVLNIIFEGKNQ